MDREETSQLPAWLREGLDAEETDSLPNKRTEPRHVWAAPVHARVLNDPAGKPLRAQTFNVGDGGLGLIFREPVSPGTELELTPAYEDGEPVRVCVIHCTQTIWFWSWRIVRHRISPP